MAYVALVPVRQMSGGLVVIRAASLRSRGMLSIFFAAELSCEGGETPREHLWTSTELSDAVGRRIFRRRPRLSAALNVCRRTHRGGWLHLF